MDCVEVAIPRVCLVERGQITALTSAMKCSCLKIHSYLLFDTLRLKSIESMKSIEIEQNSIEIDNHKNGCDRFLSISDICRLINIDFYRFLSILIEYRNYRFVTPCVKPLLRSPHPVRTCAAHRFYDSRCSHFRRPSLL